MEARRPREGHERPGRAGDLSPARSGSVNERRQDNDGLRDFPRRNCTVGLDRVITILAVAMKSAALKSAPRSRLGAAVGLALLATASAAMGWIGSELWKLSENTTFQVAGICKICGRVERVRELERASPAALPLNGDQCESIVMMVAALGGRVAGPARALSFRTYETAVRLDDGSIRIVRDTSEPPWKTGDRVRVTRGRVERVGQSAAG